MRLCHLVLAAGLLLGLGGLASATPLAATSNAGVAAATGGAELARWRRHRRSYGRRYRYRRHVLRRSRRVIVVLPRPAQEARPARRRGEWIEPPRAAERARPE